MRWVWTRLVVRASVAISAVLVVMILTLPIVGRLLPQTDQLAYMMTDNNIEWDIYLLDVDRRLIDRVTYGQYSNRYPAWSPDGRLIAFHSDRAQDRQITYDLFMARADGREQTRLTGGNIRTFLRTDQVAALGNAMPAWSPDGRFIGFHSDLDDEWDLFLVEVATGEITRLTETEAEDVLMTWSPDGDSIAYSYGDFEARYLYIMDVNTREARQVTRADAIPTPAAYLPPATIPQSVSPSMAATATALAPPTLPQTQLTVVEDWHPAWSPDGTQILFASSRDFLEDELFLLDLTSGQLQQLTNNSDSDNNPMWMPDGRRIVFTSDRDGLPSLYMMDLETGETTRLLPPGTQADGAAPRP